MYVYCTLYCFAKCVCLLRYGISVKAIVWPTILFGAQALAMVIVLRVLSLFTHAFNSTRPHRYPLGTGTCRQARYL